MEYAQSRRRRCKENILHGTKISRVGELFELNWNAIHEYIIFLANGRIVVRKFLDDSLLLKINFPNRIIQDGITKTKE